MPAGPAIILTLKVLVSAVTALLLAALVALAAGRPRLHGRLNTAFLVLVLVTVAGFELALQFVDVKAAFDPATRAALRVHLWFAVPSAVVIPVMWVTGRTGRKRVHLALAAAFVVLWAGTVVTGVVYLPH